MRKRAAASRTATARCSFASGRQSASTLWSGRFYADLWNRWDDDAVEDMLAEDFAFRGSMGTRAQGRDGWRGYRDAIRRGAPDFRNEITGLVADGQRAAARLSYTGHHAGPLAGLTATGRQFEYAGAAFFTTRDGQLASAWVLGDLDGLRRQLRPDPDLP